VGHESKYVGGIEVVPLCDARVPFLVDEEFPVGLPEGWEPYREAFPWAFVGEPMWDFHIHAFVARTADALVLIDTGIGVGAPVDWGGAVGSLAVELASAGVDPKEVAHVVYTHLHLDHIGGTMTDEGEPRFPLATHHVHPADWDAFSQADDPEDRAAFERSIRPLAEQDMLAVIPEEYDVVAGVHLVDAPGHTAGHRAVLIGAAGPQLLIAGDALHHPFQVTHPEWLSNHDADPAAAVKTRVALLDRIREGDLGACVPHFARPFGHVRADGGLRWVSDG
jgi:glyoxylase-like metal-dependent hydrolase (beta-lactamase superfamily II)